MTASEAQSIREDMQRLEDRLVKQIDELRTEIRAERAGQDECQERCRQNRSGIYERLGKLEVATAMLNLKSVAAIGIPVAVLTGVIAPLVVAWVRHAAGW